MNDRFITLLMELYVVDLWYMEYHLELDQY